MGKLVQLSKHQRGATRSKSAHLRRPENTMAPGVGKGANREHTQERAEAAVLLFTGVRYERDHSSARFQKLEKLSPFSKIIANTNHKTR